MPPTPRQGDEEEEDGEEEGRDRTSRGQIADTHIHLDFTPTLLHNEIVFKSGKC
jgi:hypothetical protein